MIPENVRDRWYFVIVMPIDPETGYGPVSEDKQPCKLTWEVWDQELTAHFDSDYLPDAIQECERLNREYYNGR
jgi:hypothetical protein